MIVSQAADGLDGRLPLQHALENLIDNDISARNGRVDIATLYAEARGEVAGLVDLRRSLDQGLFDIVDGRQFFVVDLDGPNRRPSRRVVAGGNCGHLLPDVAHLAD